MSFGGSSSQPQQQTTTYQLSPEQRELMNIALPGVRQFAATTPQRYQGTTVAGFDPAQQQAQAQALTAAGGAQQGIADTSAQALTGLLTGGRAPTAVSPMNLPANPFDAGFVNPATNPILQGAITAATRPITQQLTESILPNIRSEAQLAGQFGGSRQGIAEGLAAGRALDAIGATGANLAQQTYGTNVGAIQAARGQDIGAETSRYGTDVNAAAAADRLQAENISRALGLTPTISEAQLAPARTVGGVGDVRQAMAQALLGERVGNFNYDQLAPFLQSKEILALMAGLPGGTSISTATTPKPNPFLTALGGAATGAGLGSTFGPIGTGVGALGGGLLGLLGAR